MARGWESKAIEAQQEAATESRRGGPRASPGKAERPAEHATLMLARTRALADLRSVIERQMGSAHAREKLAKDDTAVVDARKTARKKP